MSFTPPPGLLSAQRYDQTRYRSPYLFEFRARDLFSRDPDSGLYLSRSGHQATHSRSGTATGVDSNGDNITVPPYTATPRVTSGEVGLLLGSSDVWYFDWSALPIAMTGTVVFVDRGPANNDGVIYIGNAGNTGARLWIEQGSSVYEIHHHNGSTEVSASVTGAPSTGEKVALRFALNANGSVQLWQSIDDEDETTAGASSANTLASAWSGTRMYLNSRGSGNVGDNEFRSLVLEAA